MKTCRKIFVVLNAAFVASRVGIYAQGTFEAVNTPVSTDGYTSGIVGYINNGTIGWEFSPSQSIVISSLGFLFNEINPSLAGVSVGLWSADGTLLRSTVFDGRAVAINGNLYESVSPLSVSAGSTLVIAAGSAGTFNFVGFPSSPTQYPIDYAGTLSAVNGGGFTFPTIQFTSGDAEQLIPAASFLFQTVPEPAMWTLLLCGAGLLGVMRHLRKP